MNFSRVFLFLILCIPMLAMACAGGNPVPTATPLPLPTNVKLPTATPLPSATTDLNATATAISHSIFATLTASAPTATNTPKATNTPIGGGSFGPISFAAGVLNDETPVDPLDSFPDGVTIVYAFFAGKGLKDGTPWRSEWLHNGQIQENLSKDHTWDAKTAGPEGLWWLSVYNDKDVNGVGAGEWQLTLYLDKQLQQSTKFTIEANPSNQPDFGPIAFAEDQKDDKPVNAVKVSDPTFPKGTKAVYAFFAAVNIPKGTEWTSQWFRNGEPAFDPKPRKWDAGPNEGWWVSCTSACFGNQEGTSFDPGTYELKLKIGDRLVNIGTFIVPK